MSSRARAALAALTTAATWGVSVIIAKRALHEIGPATLALARSFWAGVALLLYLRCCSPGQAIRQPGVPRIWMALRGLLGVTLFSVLWYGGIARTTATNASLIGASAPAVTALLSVPLLKERPTPVQAGGIILAVAGALLIVLFAGHPRLTSPLQLGDLLVLGSVISWALYTIIGRSRTAQDLGLTTLTAYDLLSGALLLLPLAARENVTEGPRSLASTPTSLVLLLSLCIITAGTYLLWNQALTAMTASELATYLNVSPVVTLVSARLFLGEAIRWGQVGGGTLTLIGVYLVTRGRPG